jgi:hypothetical protein
MKTTARDLAMMIRRTIDRTTSAVMQRATQQGAIRRPDRKQTRLADRALLATFVLATMPGKTMRTAISISMATLLISCTDPAQSSKLDAALGHYVPGVSVSMNATDFLRLAGASADGNGGVLLALGDSARGFTELMGRFGSASEPLDSLALPRRVELHAEGAKSGAIADSARSALTQLLDGAAAEACSGRDVVPLRVSWWQTAEGIVFLQSSEGEPIASLSARARLVVVPSATSISDAVGTETATGRCGG